METENVQNETLEQGGVAQNVTDGIAERLDFLEREFAAQKLRHRFEQAATMAGIRSERIDDAFMFVQQTLSPQSDDGAMLAAAENIAVRFPEFLSHAQTVEVDLGVPGTIASANSKNALDMLRNLRK